MQSSKFKKVTIRKIYVQPMDSTRKLKESRSTIWIGKNNPTLKQPMTKKEIINKIQRTTYYNPETVRIEYPEYKGKKVDKSFIRYLNQKKRTDLIKYIEDTERQATYDTIIRHGYNVINRTFKHKNKKLEFLINLMLFGLSFQVSWGIYLFGFPDGHKMITDLFFKPSKTSTKNLLALIMGLHITGVRNDDIIYEIETLQIPPIIINMLFNDPEQAIKTLDEPFLRTTASIVLKQLVKLM